MTKAVSIFMIALMAVQLIWPLGLPGLKERGDFWKLALLAIVAMMATVLLKEVTGVL
ncbi:MAG: hypothetical protein INR68_09875 [Methylobacterium mesophilicum]|nr:hypothetical protein [Methylobacterium mesophilicum]